MSDTAPPRTCPRCGDDHEAVECPHVKAVNFDHDGNITRLEFLTPADYGPTKEYPKPEAGPAYARLGADESKPGA